MVSFQPQPFKDHFHLFVHFKQKYVFLKKANFFLRLKDEFQFSAGSKEDKVHSRKVASNKILGGPFIALAK